MPIDELKDYFDERLHDMETKLIREFRKWAMPIEGSRRVQQVLNSNVDERLSALEQRVSDLESKA